jgi:hypothetical protein
MQLTNKQKIFSPAINIHVTEACLEARLLINTQHMMCITRSATHSLNCYICVMLGTFPSSGIEHHAARKCGEGTNYLTELEPNRWPCSLGTQTQTKEQQPLLTGREDWVESHNGRC